MSAKPSEVTRPLAAGDKPVRVLLVDPGGRDRESVELALSSGGELRPTLRPVETAEEALRVSGDEAFDVVLLDVTSAESFRALERVVSFDRGRPGAGLSNGAQR